jgi:tetratricopeptide (TPR) repeat protein
MKTVIICILTTLLCPNLLIAEHVRGDFDRLPLMREIAVKDNNKRAIENIDYIYKTPNGKYFEVDNSNLPIESLITKNDRTKQKKPLTENRDENVLIYYFHRVDNFAQSYFNITDSLIMGIITPKKAADQFKKLGAEYEDFGAAYRAKGLCAFVTEGNYTASEYYGKAVDINKFDYKALILSSMREAAVGNKNGAIGFYKRAAKSGSEFLKNFWELQYLKGKKPEAYSTWKKIITESN